VPVPEEAIWRAGKKNKEGFKMSWLDFVKSFFEKKARGQDHSWKALQRKNTEEKAYQQWVEKKTYLNWAPCIFKSYHFQKCKVKGPFRLQIIQSANKKGVVLFFSPEIGKDDFRHLFQFIKDQSLQVGYLHYLSDQRVITHDRYTETIDKHYLKPPPTDLPGSALCNQLYGNIMIDLVSINGQPGFIRFNVNTYRDPLFSQPLPFDDLMDKVFNTEKA
jgi:hypothetical protein